MTAPDQQSEVQRVSDLKESSEPGQLIRLVGLLGILLITVAAGIGRIVELDRYPGGLLDAEAQHGLLARESTNSSLRWLIDGAAELSTTLAAVIAVVGSASQFDAVAPRIAAGIIGTSSVLVTGLWLRRELGSIWGIAGAAVLAGSFWHILFSRLALGPIAGAMSLGLMLWCLSEAAARRGQAALPWYALAGVAAGIGFLSTPSLRLLPLAILGILGLTLYRAWEGETGDDSSHWLLTSVTALLVALPFILSHSDDLRTLTPWAPTAGLPGDDSANLLELPGAAITTLTALALPDVVQRGMNLPSDAFLSVLLLPWALIGLLGLFSASNNPANRDRFIGGGIILLAVLLGISAVDAGHPGHLVVASPLIAGLVTYGFRTAVHWARIRTVRLALIALVVTGVAGNAAWSFDRYVNEWAGDPATRSTFSAGDVAALQVVETLDEPGPIFVSTLASDELLAYFVSPARRHTFDGSRYLPFPADEDGYLVVSDDAPLDSLLETLLAQVPELTLTRDESRASAYRLDQRIREEMPLSAPTVPYNDGLVFHGGTLTIDPDRETANVLVAWRVPAGSDANAFDVRLSPTSPGPGESDATVELFPNPLETALFQAFVLTLELPEDDGEFDLEVRLRDTDGNTIHVSGATPEGWLLLNRYRLEAVSPSAR